MRERVSVFHGKNPFVIVSPHGPDDKNTDIIAEACAVELDCFGVVNRGFERSQIVDVDNDQADCNRIDHANEDVVKDEFLNPIVKFAKRIANKAAMTNPSWAYTDSSKIPEKALVFYVHGAGNNVHQLAGEPVEVIVGYGKGSGKLKDSLTCEAWRKNLFIAKYRAIGNKGVLTGEIYEGKGGGKYAGRSGNNLNQYFRVHDYDEMIDCMQLEYPYSTRKTDTDAAYTGRMLAAAIAQMIGVTSYNDAPKKLVI